MNIIKLDELNAYKLFDYWNEIAKEVPYFYTVTIDDFIDSLFNDKQLGENVFNYLETYLVEENDTVLGFIQFGNPHIYIDTKGERCYDPNIGAIRNIYFDENRFDVGKILIKQAEDYFNKNNFEAHFAFNHGLGVSCNACHGKLLNSKSYIENFLVDYGFNIEQENIYYRIYLSNISKEIIERDLEILKEGRNEYNFELLTLLYKGKIVGQSKLLYLDKIKTVYMKTIWLDSSYQNMGLGSKFIKLICNDLFELGYVQMDLDTAKNNIIAQNFYAKNGFINKGITRSYIK